MKKGIKVLLIVILICSVMIGGFFWLLAGNYVRVKTDIDKYETDLQQVSNAAAFMPKLDALSGYTNIKYTYQNRCYSTLAGFYSDAFALFVTYDQNQYQTAKRAILSEYTFLEEPVMGSTGAYELPVTEFEYEGYHFKIVPDKEYLDYCACKSFMMIGVNDETSSIVYMYYYDFDIDYIAEVGDHLEEEMYELIDTAFAWAD